MKIVHVTTSFLEKGLSQKESMLVRQQLSDGHDVQVIAAQTFHQSWVKILAATKGEDRSGESSLSSRITRLPVQWKYADLIWCKDVTKAVHGLRPDIWHLHEPAHGLPLQVAQSVSGTAPILIDQHQFMVSFTGKPIVEAEYRLVRQHIVSRAYSFADHVVSVTSGGAEFLQQWHRVSRNMISVIPLGFDPTIFSVQPEQRQAQRQRLGISSDEVLLITSGSLYPFKRHEDLLLAFQQVLALGRTVRLLIVGGGDRVYVQKLHQLARRLGLEKAIIWEPLQREQVLAELFNAADAAIWPLFPTISISQAMACGLPVVLAEGPGQGQFTSLGVGPSFISKSSKSMAEAILQVLDTNQRRHWAAHNRDIASSELSLPRIATRYESAYQQAKEHFQQR